LQPPYCSQRLRALADPFALAFHFFPPIFFYYFLNFQKNAIYIGAFCFCVFKKLPTELFKGSQDETDII